MGDSDFTITCPCCKAKMMVDRISGAILAHEAPPEGPAKTFEEAMLDVKKHKAEVEDKFAQAVREHENREEILDKKFKEAFKRAEKDDKPPPRPFDFD